MADNIKASKKEKSSVVEKRSKKNKQQKGMLCENLSFAAAESYKLLRTNLLFSLPDKNCRILGITSSVRGEGKSTTSVNLAFTFAQTGKRVLLIDADMRLPSIATKLEMHSTPGLSNLLAGLSAERSCLRMSENFDNWFILPAGDIPPNPSELLGSERMHTLLERYSEVFDYIIIDLPPVNIVVDALVISKWTDGLIVVVRQNYSDRRALDDCMYQIQKLNAKMLGFVMTDANIGTSSYKHYGKYGKNYGYGSDYGYGTKSSHTSKKKTQAFLDVTLDDSKEFDPSASDMSARDDASSLSSDETAFESSEK